MKVEDWNRLMKLSDENALIMERINKRGKMNDDLIKKNQHVSLSDATKMYLIDGCDQAGDLRRIYVNNQETKKILDKY